MFSISLRRLTVTFLLPCVMLLGFPQRSYAVVPVAAVAWAVTYAAGVYRAVKWTDLVVGTVLAGIALYADNVANKTPTSPPAVTADKYAAYVNLKPDRVPTVPSGTYPNGSPRYATVCDGAGKNCMVGQTGPTSASSPGWECPGGDCTFAYQKINGNDYLAQGFSGFTYVGSSKYAVGAITPLYTPGAFTGSQSSVSSGYALPESTPCEIVYNGSSFTNNSAPSCASGAATALPTGTTGGTLPGIYSGETVAVSAGAGGLSITDSGSASAGVSGASVSTGGYSSSAGGYPVTGVTAVPVSNTGTGTGTGSGEIPPFIMPCGIAGTPGCNVTITDSIAATALPVLNPVTDSDRPDAVSWLQSRLPSTPTFTWSHPFTSASCSAIPVSYSIFGKSHSYSWDFCKFISVYQDALSWLAYLLTCFQLYALAVAPRRESSSSTI